MNAYDTGFDPPALCAEVTIANILNRRKRRTVKAIFDTGADITAIPEAYVTPLDLYAVDSLQLEMIEGTTSIAYTYAVKFTLGELVLPRLEVILTGLDIVIVGRDVVNQLYLRLDGPVGEFAFQLTPFDVLEVHDAYRH